MNINNWIYQEFDIKIADNLAQKYKIPHMIANLLCERNLIEDREIRAFLHPNYKNLHSPLELKDMDIAVNRIKTALRKKEKITIYGDYDVDGITSVTILSDYLMKFGANVDYYIPDRILEGYGINQTALQKIIESGTNLLITVDSGITACDEVDFAMKNGMDVIVTDHHECQDTLPKAVAVVDAKREDSGGYQDYCGAGLSLMLILALDGMVHVEQILNEYSAFAALGTVADVMPLLSDNRILVTEGVKQIAQTKNIGLTELLKAAQLYQKEITATKIAFILAPRINAAGRIGKAQRAVELFLSKSQGFCENLAKELCDENDQRKSTESIITEEVMKYIESRIDLETDKVLVVSGENWHHGVLGIVTSKITEKYRRPAILISFDENGIGKGSGRSIKEFNLFNALSHCSKYLIRYGGHEMAAGLSIDHDNLEPFKKALSEYASGKISNGDFVPKIYIDCSVIGDEINLSNYKKMKHFQPFGSKNPEPVFSIDNAKIMLIRKVGMEKHLKLFLKIDGKELNAIGFGMGTYADFLKVGDIIKIAFTLSANDFYEIPKEQIIIKDIKIS